MVSPELLRRYVFFADLDDGHLKAVAMLTDEAYYGQDEVVFEEGQPADALYLLIEGCVDLHYVVTDEINTQLSKDFFISEINPGEVFGISALLEPYVYTGTVRSTCPGHVLKIEAAGLRALCEMDTKLCATLIRHIAKATMSRLHDTRVQLAAARV